MLTQRTWSFPVDGSAFDIPVGASTIDIPSTLLSRFRNLSIEFIFSGVTATDENLSINTYRANSTDAFSISNIEAVVSPVTITSSVTSNSDLVFIRDIKNIDNNFVRLVIDAPSGVTASLVVNVSAGGNAL